MEIITTLLSPDAFVEPPQGIFGWVLWFGLLFLNLFLLWRWRIYNKPMNEQRWGLIILLGLLTPLTSLFIGLRLPPGVVSPPPGVPVDPLGPAILVFSVIPWMIAAGFLGPTAAAGIGIYSGLLTSLWETHNPYTPLIASTLAILFAAMMSQRYRTSLYKLIRHPLAGAVLLTFIYPVLYLLTTPFSTQIPASTRLEYTLNHWGIALLIVGVELFFGGLFTEIIAGAVPEHWGGVGNLVPSPAEKSLQLRLLFIFAPLTLLLVFGLLAGDWYFAGRAAQGMFEDNMSSTANVAVSYIPYFIESGHLSINEITQDPGLQDMDTAANIETAIAYRMSQRPFFDQILVFDDERELVAAYPGEENTGTSMPIDEQYGIISALKNFPIQIFSLPPEEGKSGAQISFIAPIVNENANEVVGAVVGRTDLKTNSLSIPIITSLSSTSEIEGTGYLLDHDNKILYHQDDEMVYKDFPGLDQMEEGFFEGLSPDGTPSLVYYEQADGSPWSVLIMVPKNEADQLSVTIAIPLLVIAAILISIGFVILRYGLHSVTQSLRNLAADTGMISAGKMDTSVPVKGEDEVGQLGESLENMRIKVKDRLEKLDRLVMISHGIASNYQIGETLKSICVAGLETNADSVRIVIPPEMIPSINGGSKSADAFGAGPSENIYKYLDEQILAYARRHDRLVLTNLLRPRLFNLPNKSPHPESLIAIALQENQNYYGVLWAAYDEPHTFSTEEVGFLSNLAKQAAISIANTRQFLNSEIERQQLSAILSSSPDPILVTDTKNNLLIANPAAWEILGLRVGVSEQNPLEEIIPNKDLLNLMRSPSSEPQTIEVTLPNRQVYLATATPVLNEDERIGRICVLTDVTRLKEINALKSEFVSTVSHDMRHPLTLIHGYASMVEMVGPLNEQQAAYLEKIVENVDSLSHLVTNLLDLRRIEAGIGLHIELVQVRVIVDKVVQSLEPQAIQKRIRLSAEIPLETVPLIEADQALLQKAIHNLVENGIKYTNKEGYVKIRAYCMDDRIIFEISDNGVGISPVDQAQLFERFYHRPKKDGLFETSGSGLGLAIVKSIADRHNGQVWVESQLGQGSTFYLSIPQRAARTGD